MNLTQSLAEARAAAEEEARLRETGQAMWTPERLRVSMQSKTLQSPLVVVSNREPYMHVHRNKGIEALVPASGLVTALEPILRACDGTWIASGSGDADRETVDEHDRLRVPPDKPEYTLRRVWLTKEEEEGYYYGFSNEGLWPLCHIAYTRPIFRASDWKSYQEANRKFADAVLQEIETRQASARACAGLSFRVAAAHDQRSAPRRASGDFLAHSLAQSGSIWNLPVAARTARWPAGRGPDRFSHPGALQQFPRDRGSRAGIADRMGAVCRKAPRSDDAGASVSNQRGFPRKPGGSCRFRVSVRSAHGTPEESGDRSKLSWVLASTAIDYTKGIIERFRGVERFLERWPTYRGQFTFVQIGAPSRTHIPRYHDFVEEVEAEAARINTRFQTSKWKPIVLLARHHSTRKFCRTTRRRISAWSLRCTTV